MQGERNPFSSFVSFRSLHRWLAGKEKLHQTLLGFQGVSHRIAKGEGSGSLGQHMCLYLIVHVATHVPRRSLVDSGLCVSPPELK